MIHGLHDGSKFVPPQRPTLSTEPPNGPNGCMKSNTTAIAPSWRSTMAQFERSHAMAMTGQRNMRRSWRLERSFDVSRLCSMARWLLRMNGAPRPTASCRAEWRGLPKTLYSAGNCLMKFRHIKLVDGEPREMERDHCLWNG